MSFCTSAEPELDLVFTRQQETTGLQVPADKTLGGKKHTDTVQSERSTREREELLVQSERSPQALSAR